METERVLILVNKLDVPQSISGETQLRLVQLEYTSAKRMAPLLSKIFSEYYQRFFLNAIDQKFAIY